MSPSLPTPAFLYILNIFLSPALPKSPFFHNCHATPKGHGLPPPQNSERARGRGGLFGPDHQIIDHNVKTALSSTSKLGDFFFLSIRHILAEF